MVRSVKNLHILCLPENTNLPDIPYKLHNFNMSHIKHSIRHFENGQETGKQASLSRVKKFVYGTEPKKMQIITV